MSLSNLKVTCPKCAFNYVIPLNRELVRTLPQNSLYWGVYIKTIADHIGEECPEDLHEELKLMFNPKDSKLKLGHRYGGSTKKMKRREFTDYLLRIRVWAFKFHGITLPEPETKKGN